MTARTISEEVRKSSGRAHCDQCDTHVEKGATYRREFYEFDGYVYTINSCGPCDEFYRRCCRASGALVSHGCVTKEHAIAWAQEHGIVSDDEAERAASVGFLTRLGLTGADPSTVEQ